MAAVCFRGYRATWSKPVYRRRYQNEVDLSHMRPLCRRCQSLTKYFFIYIYVLVEEASMHWTDVVSGMELELSHVVA